MRLLTTCPRSFWHLLLSNLIISFTRASASAVRINEVFAVKSSMNEASSKVNEYAEANSPKVEFKMFFSYNQSEEEALSGISFRVESGETVGIIGGTGSGKSTLVNLIPCFYDVTYGEILIDGKNVKDYAFSELRKKIAVVPPKSSSFQGTIRQNMQWGKEDATDEEIYRALEIAQARDFVDEKPDGLDFEILQGGKNLSRRTETKTYHCRGSCGRATDSDTG